MAYTPTKTWASGSSLNATDLQDNLDGIKKYNQKIVGADLKATKWVDTKHVMPGVINAKTNVTSNCSGVYGGQQHSWQVLNYTFLTRWNSTRSAATIRNIIIPETSFTLDLGRPATLFYQFWAQAQSKDDGYTDGLSYFFATADGGVTVPNGTQKMTEQSQAAVVTGVGSIDVGANISGTKYFSGFLVQEPTIAAEFGVGLYGRTFNGQCAVFSWGVSIEVFYM